MFNILNRVLKKEIPLDSLEHELSLLDPDSRCQFLYEQRKIERLFNCGANFGHIEYLATLGFDVWTQVLKRYIEVEELIECGVDFWQILELEFDVRSQILENWIDIGSLVEGGFKFKHIIALDAEARTQLLEKYIAVKALIECGVQSKQLVALESDVRTQLLKEYILVSELIECGIEFEQIVGLESHLRTQLFDISWEIKDYFNTYKVLVSIDQICSVLKLQLSEEETSKKINDIYLKNKEIVKNSQTLGCLMYDNNSRFFKLPLETLIQISSLMGNKPNVIEDDEEAYKIAYKTFPKDENKACEISDKIFPSR